VVVLVGFQAQRFLTLQHDDRDALRIRFVEELAHPVHRGEGRRIVGNEGQGFLSFHRFQRWHRDRRQHRESDPAQDDQDRVPTDERRYARSSRFDADAVEDAHAACRRQEAKAFTWCETFSSLTSSPTMMRQPMLLLSPCAKTLPSAVVLLISICNDQGSATFSMNCGSVFSSK